MINLGRVSRQAAKVLHAPSASAQSKMNRRNHAKQIQLQKRQSLLAAMRIFGGVGGAPRVVAVVPLCDDVTSRAAVSTLAECLELPPQTDNECTWKIKFVGPTFCFCVSSLSLLSFSEGWNDLKRPCSLSN
jgi:pre-rRNA-processing protein TSR1